MTPGASNRAEVEDLRQRLEMYERIFESIYNGSMVTDAEGYITHFNKPYGQFLGLDPEAQIGKHCVEAVENTRMHIVAKTGKPEINQTHRIMGQDMVVQRIPIKKDGKVIAVFGCSGVSFKCNLNNLSIKPPATGLHVNPPSTKNMQRRLPMAICHQK